MAPFVEPTIASDLPDLKRVTRGARLGPYEITGFIGAGGMGVVYRAHDTNLNRVVALKLLPAHVAADPEQLQRFDAEAKAVSALNHPAIVTVYDAGQIGNQPYISMEFVAGDTLRDILKVGAIPLRRALQIGGQISDGLAKAHDVGFVHRDLKPENIKVSVDGFAKILDFGLAKRISTGPSEEPVDNERTLIRTAPGMVLGTVGYMSPEQASGGAVEFHSDQFSFGAVLYEMLTGRRAFERPTVADTLSAIIRDEPFPIVQINPAVPPPVRWIIDRCLAKDPHDRYALTRDLARDLVSASEHLGELLASRRIRPAHRQNSEPSLAVLPVINLSNDPKNEVLADAMTDALITELVQYRGLRIISRASSMVYRGRRNSLADLAEELGVEWVLLASIARVGGWTRINAQLVDAASDENRWARSYTRRARDILSIQADAARDIAHEVNAALGTGHEIQRTSQTSTAGIHDCKTTPRSDSHAKLSIQHH
ncbi:MAG TPA: serine/threonine-protein kinase [Vicinamibacterales bacterium]|nr:serine/threonine-protein kinase [Vicinamibacterales bacterium]